MKYFLDTNCVKKKINKILVSFLKFFAFIFYKFNKLINRTAPYGPPSTKLGWTKSSRRYYDITYYDN